MKKAIQFEDALGNITQLKTAIDTFRQVDNKPCWIVESRKIFPQVTKWERLYSLENQYFETDEDALKTIKKYVSEYAEKMQNLGKNFQFKEVDL